MDPGSGAFLTPESGIWNPGSGMGKKSRSGSTMNILDHISESLETIFWIKILKFFDADADPGSDNLFDPGSGMEKIRIWYPDEQPGSATLEVRLVLAYHFWLDSTSLKSRVRTHLCGNK